MSSWSFPVLIASVFTVVGIRAGSHASSTRAPEADPKKAQTSTLEAAPAMFFADFDGDGLLDAYAIYSGSDDRLFRNLGDGSFEDVTARAGLAGLDGSRAGLWADFDRDGDLDLYLVAERSDRKLFHNRGDGRFEDVTRMAGLSGIAGELDAAWIDYDADSRPDLSIRTASGDLLYHNTGEKWFERVELGLPIGAPVDGGHLRTVGENDPTDVPSRGETLPGDDEGFANAAPGERSGVGQPPARERQSSSSSAPFAPSGGAVGPLPPSATLGPVCAGGIFDQALPTNCIPASSTPTLGELYPMSTSLNVSQSGNIGIGTTGPTRTLQVSSSQKEFARFTTSQAAQNNYLTVETAGGDSSIGIQIGATGSGNMSGIQGGNGELRFITGGTDGTVMDGTSAMAILSTGNIGIGIATPTSRLAVAGSTRTQCVTITGGCDIVESFETGGQVYEPGTVLVIDATRPGELVQSTSPYDRKVAGVVSGAGGVQPGIMLSQEGVLDGNTKVAMAGRVHVKCSTANGPIEAGDLLTTASIPGHAMKATDAALSHGTIIGKAMSVLSEGEGLVLVLVNLH